MADETKAAVDAVKELNIAFSEFKATNNERIKQLEGKGVDPVTEAKLAKIEADMDKVHALADEAVLAAKRQSRIVTDENGNAIDLDAKAEEWAHAISKRNGKRVDGYKADSLAMYAKSFEAFMRSGEQSLEPDQYKALSVGSDPDGGFFVTPDTSGRMIKRIFDTSAVRAYASVQVISTDSLKGINDLGEAAVTWEGETAAPAEGNTPQVGEWRIPVHEMRALHKASQQVIEDASVNVESWLSDKIADKMARAESTAFVSGTGVGQPRGFLTYADFATAGVSESGKIEQFDTGVNGGFAAAPAGGDILISALYSLKAPYRANATWFMNRSVMAAVRKLKDSDGAYIWSPGIAAGQPATLLGYAAATFEDMPDLATGSLSIGVGDLRAAYQIVDRLGISIMRDPYSYKPYVGFYARKRVGGDVLDFDALKLIKFAG